MVPLVDARGRQPAPRWLAEPGVAHALDFPPWTRDDDGEDEVADYTQNRRRASPRNDGTRRNTHRRSLSTDQYDHDALTPTPVKRGFFKQLEEAAAPVISAVFKPLLDHNPFIPKFGKVQSSDDDDSNDDGIESPDSPDETTPAPKLPPPPAKTTSVETPPIVEVPAKPDKPDKPDKPEKPDKTNKPGSVPPPPVPTTPPAPRLPSSPASKDSGVAGKPPATTPSKVSATKPASSPAPTSKDNPPPESKPTPEATGSPLTTMTPIIDKSSGIITESAPTKASNSGIVLSLTPIITAVPALSSGDRKGVGSAAPTDPDFSETRSYDYASSTATYDDDRYETAGPEKNTDEGQRSGMSEGGEKAVIGVGVVVAIFVIALVSWLLWRYMKRSHPGKYSDWKRRLPTAAAFDKPKRRMASAISRVPFIKTRAAKEKGWQNLDEPIGERFAEKGPLSSNPPGQGQVKPLGIRVHTEFTRQSEYEYGLERPASIHSRAPNLAVPALQVPYNQPPGSNAAYVNIRASDISSLSSGFGDGDIIMPPATAGNTLAAPAPFPTPTTPRNPRISGYRTSDMSASRKRDTISTQASSDSAPRFRTVNSWVRQQSGRIKRAARLRDSDAPPVPGLPPEQEFKLMMPDGEVPRRVEEGKGVVYGVAE